MNLIVDPASGLLDSEVAPLLLVQQATARCITVHSLGQEDVTVLVLIVLVLLAIFNFVREVRHSKVSQV